MPTFSNKQSAPTAATPPRSFRARLVSRASAARSGGHQAPLKLSSEGSTNSHTHIIDL